MEISGLNPLYQILADMIWACQDNDQVQAVIAEYGRPALTVYQLIIAAHYDEAVQDYADVELAQQVIDNLLK